MCSKVRWSSEVADLGDVEVVVAATAEHKHVEHVRILHPRAEGELLIANVPYVSIDQLVLSDDPSVQPSGIEGADTTSPPAPAAVLA